MMLQMEKVIPAGTNKFGSASESSWVVLLLSGRITARALIRIVSITARIFPICSSFFFVRGIIYSTPHMRIWFIQINFMDCGGRKFFFNEGRLLIHALLNIAGGRLLQDKTLLLSLFQSRSFFCISVIVRDFFLIFLLLFFVLLYDRI